MKMKWPGIIILVGFLLIGAVYAIKTPRWQVPDEPAHYNYIRYLVETQRFPEMAPGDYDQPYLSRLTAERFPPELPVDSVSYEDHQPPLYYLLMAPVYAFTEGSVVGLRLFTVCIGAAAVLFAILLLHEGWTMYPGAVWVASGLLAFTPQFVAMMAAVNNDALLLALLWLWLWLALRYLQNRTSPWVLGVVLGFVLLTKLTGYGAFPLAVLVILVKNNRMKQPTMSALRGATCDAGRVFLPAVFLGSLWWLRNLIVYGWPDMMGLIRHGEVVIGQPRTATAISQNGLLPFLLSAVRTTFQSFWGQFGWMGVVLDDRIYRGLLVFTLCAFVGAVSYVLSRKNDKTLARERDAFILLGMSTAITATMYVGYNITFIQHQGRYLFPALPMIAMMLSLGLRQLLKRKTSLGVILLLVICLLVVGIQGLALGDIEVWWIILLGGAAIMLLSTFFVPKTWHALYAVGVVGMLALLDMVCLFWFVIPMLS